MKFTEAYARTLAAYHHVKLSFNPFQIQNTTKSVIEALVMQYALTHFEALLKDMSHATSEREASENDADTFEFFLNDYWDLIKGTDASYFHQPFSPISHLCFTLAQDLAALAPMQPDHLRHDPYRLHKAYQFLVPTLRMRQTSYNPKPGDLSGTIEGTLPTLDECLPKLSSFLLSDDAEELIDVVACLESAVDNNDNLRYTSIRSAKGWLKKNEIKRVLQHSDAASKCYDSLQDYLNEKNKGFSFGSYVNNLSNGLIAGGVKGGKGGTEYLAADAANIAIAEFRDFVNALTADEKAWLLSFSEDALDEDEESLGIFWRRLDHPIQPMNEDDDQSASYCVDSIGNEIHRILKANETLLYGTKPQFLMEMDEANHVTILNHKKLLVENDKALFADTELSQQCVVKSTYGQASIKKLTKRIFSFSYMNVLLNNMNDTERKSLAIEMGDDFLSILKNMPMHARALIVSLISAPYLSLIAPTIQHIELIKDLIHENEIPNFVDLLFEADISYLKEIFTQVDQVIAYLQCLEENERALVFFMLAENFLASFISSPGILFKLLNVLPESFRKTALDEMGKDYLKDMHLTLDQKIILASLFPLEDKECVLNYCHKRKREDVGEMATMKYGLDVCFFRTVKTIEQDEEERPRKRQRVS